MKKTFAIAAFAALLLPIGAMSQSKAKVVFPEYTFTTVKENPITSVKNQYRSGTCWVYSSLGFIESEIMRINGIKDPEKCPDLSEFFVVSHSYLDRAEKYVRLDGNLGFSAGSSFGDVLHVIRDYGIVPQQEMTGMNYGTELPEQAELDGVLKSYVRSVLSTKGRGDKLTTAWKNGFKGILDAYLGAWPEKFTADGREYTPESYRDALKIDPDDYVSLTSFSHHPFYSSFVIEVCDNWRWDESYNLPIDELMKVIDDAIMDGYTIAWGADVSHEGFNRQGIGMYVDSKAKKAGSDQEHWLGKETENAAGKDEVKIVEGVPTQESRQLDFDNKTLTDDHGMQIYGIAKNQDGTKFYMVKNSWGTDKKKYEGIWYVSEAYVKAQTLNIVINKSALHKDIKKKLSL